VISSLFKRLTFILRCPRSAVVILLTKCLSLAPTLGYTSFHFSYATFLKRLARSSIFHGSSKSVYLSAKYVRFKGLLSKSEAYENFYPFRGDWVVTPFMVSGWNSDFLFFNRGAHLQPTGSSSPMVRPHILHHPHSFMVCSCARHMHRDIRPC
jgi:hypothetical protein